MSGWCLGVTVAHKDDADDIIDNINSNIDEAYNSVKINTEDFDEYSKIIYVKFTSPDYAGCIYDFARVTTDDELCEQCKWVIDALDAGEANRFFADEIEDNIIIVIDDMSLGETVKQLVKDNWFHMK